VNAVLPMPCVETDCFLNPRTPVPFQISRIRATLGLLVTGMLVGEVGLVVGSRVGLRKEVGPLVGRDAIGGVRGGKAGSTDGPRVGPRDGPEDLPERLVGPKLGPELGNEVGENDCDCNTDTTNWAEQETEL